MEQPKVTTGMNERERALFLLATKQVSRWRPPTTTAPWHRPEWSLRVRNTRRAA